MLWCGHPGIQRCVETLFAGGVIAYPTEAVWGLGCDPNNQHAVEHLISLKQRDSRKGLILVASDIAQFDFLIADLSREDKQKLLASWPGPNTWLVPHAGRVLKSVSGDHKTVAIRVSDHPVVKQLCNKFGGPIVSSSANIQGRAAAQSQFQVRRIFSKSVVYAPGVTGGNKRPSTIRDLRTNELVRL